MSLTKVNLLLTEYNDIRIELSRIIPVFDKLIVDMLDMASIFNEDETKIVIINSVNNALNINYH